MPGDQCRFWLGTLHVPETLSRLVPIEEEAESALRDWTYDRYADVAALLEQNKITGWCGQLEIAPTPEEGRNGAHLQYYVVTPKKITLPGLKNVLSSTAACWNRSHLVMCTATERSLDCVKEYCYDDEKDSKADFVEKFMIGTFPSGNTGNQRGAQLEQLRERIMEGASLRELALAGDVPLDLLAPNMRFIDRMTEEFRPRRNLQQDPVWIYMFSAESGTGKTYWVEKGGLEAWSNGKYTFDDVYTWSSETGGNARWITPEASSKRVWHLQEFSGNHCRQDAFKEMIGRGPYRVQGKGIFVECLAEVIITTSNFDIEECWADLKAEKPDIWERNMVAIRRRLRDFGHTPNFRLYLRNARLMERYMQAQQEQGAGPTPSRRISPVSVLDTLAGMGTDYDTHEVPSPPEGDWE